MALQPKQLLIIDGFGAILSAIILGIAAYFNSLIGMPKSTLILLAFFPCVFAVYDFYCYFRYELYDKHQLRNIAYSNLIYCFISIGFLIQFRNEITELGWFYFVVEILIISVLISLEFKADKKAI